MKQRLAAVMFAYGCVGSVAALVWLSIALAPIEVHRPSLWLMEGLFIIHGCVLVLTFHRNPGTVMWPPVLRISAKRLKSAKLILFLSTANVLVWLISIFVLALRNEKSAAEWVLSPFLASCGLLSTVYLTLHWGFRPENLLSRGFLAFATNPFGAIFRRLVR